MRLARFGTWLLSLLMILSLGVVLSACSTGVSNNSSNNTNANNSSQSNNSNNNTNANGNSSGVNQNNNGNGVANPSQGDHLLFVEPDDGAVPVVNAIKAAKSSVDMVMYLLSDRDVIGALQDAQQRGVQVRVMLEEHPYGGGSGNQSIYQTLQKAGVNVKWTNPVFRLTHEKALVMDDKVALVMTLNTTYSAFTKNREYGIVTYKPAEVQEVLAGFNADWNRAAFNPAEGSSLVWSNANSRRKIIAFIDSSQHSLVMEQEEMQDSEIQQHLVSAARRGVKIQILVAASTSSSSSDPNQAGEQQAQAGGAQVRTINSPYMHAKIYLADDNRVIICSENVSTSSLDNNRELGIIVSDPEIVKRVSQTFQKDWSRGTGI